MVKLFPSLPDNLAYTSGTYLTTVRMLSFDVHIITHARTLHVSRQRYTKIFTRSHTPTHTQARTYTQNI